MLVEALEHLVRGIVDHPDDVSVRSRAPRGATALAGSRRDARGARPPRRPRAGHRPVRSHRHRAAHRAPGASSGKNSVRVDFVDVDRRR